MADVKELCSEAAEAMIDASEAEARAGRMANLATKLETRLAEAPSDEAREALLSEYRVAAGGEASEGKRGRPKKNP